MFVRQDMPFARLTFFGAPRIESDGARVTFRRRKAVALLALLAVDARHVERDELAALFWPDLDHERARAALRQTLWEIGGAPLPRLLQSDNNQLNFDAENAAAWVDVIEFRRLLMSPATPGTAISADNLRRATELYRSGFLSGFGVRGSAEFELWQTRRTEELRAAFLGALAGLTEAHRARGEQQLAVAAARRLVAADPYNEKAHRRLMRLYAETGDRAAALRQFARCARTLADELGVRPQAATVHLGEAIKRGDAPAPEPPTAREQITIAEPRAHAPAVLPQPTTAFVGREKELTVLTERLAADNCRLLTLVGLGGMGKTRLALRAAELVRERFPEGRYFIALAGVTSRPMLVTAIARAVGAEASTTAGADSLEELLAHLRGKSLLLLLDNFEHLLDCGDALAAMLETAARVKLLVTSRQRLQLQGEWVFEVRGLDYPPEQADAPPEKYQAVQLFTQTARRTDHLFELSTAGAPDVARICRVTEGMPLAIELAASWVRALSCRQIADEIAARSLDLLTSSWRDLPPRHRNMRAVLDISYRTLDAHERAAVRQLAVFPQDFDEDAAAAVAGARRPILAALLDKSLLRREGGEDRARFSFHELIRQFVAEKFAENADEAEAARDRHCLFYANLAAVAGEDDRPEHQRRLAAEAGNMRAGWLRAIAAGNSAGIAAYAGAIFRFYDLKGFFEEGYATFGDAAEVVAVAARHDDDKADGGITHGRLLTMQGAFAAHLGMNERAAELLTEALPFLTGKAATLNRADCLNRLGMVLYHLGRNKEARRHLRASLDIYRAGGEHHGVMIALNRLAYLAGADKNYGEAERLLEESLSLSRAHGTPQEMANSLNDLGYALYLAGKHDRSRALLEENLALCEEIGYRKGSAATLDNLGCVAQAVGDLREAARRFHAALVVAKELGAQPLTLDIIKCIAALRAQDAPQQAHSVALLRFIVDHPAAWKVTKEEAQRLLRQLEKDSDGRHSRPHPPAPSIEKITAELLAEE